MSASQVPLLKWACTIIRSASLRSKSRFLALSGANRVRPVNRKSFSSSVSERIPICWRERVLTIPEKDWVAADGGAGLGGGL